MNGYDLHNVLTQRVRIEQPVRTPDGQGGATTAWQLVAECFAEVEAQNDTRSTSGKHREQAIVRYRVKIRPNPAITHQMRVVWKSRIFTIHHTLLYAAHTILVCEEEIAA